MPDRELPTDSHSLAALRALWTCAIGSFAAVMLCALFVAKLWLPAVVLGLYVVLNRVNRAFDKHLNRPGFVSSLRVAERALAATCAIMAAILAVAHSPAAALLLDDPAATNPEIPYVTILILAPAAFVLSLSAFLRTRAHRPSELTFIQQITYGEWLVQLRVMAIGAALVAAYAWAYYLLRYSNVNYNSADRFFFIWLPMILCVLSIVKMSMRYKMLAIFCRRYVDGRDVDCPMSTTVRFLIVCGDRLLLTPAGGETPADTPAEAVIAHRESLDERELGGILATIAGRQFKPSVLRLLYVNHNYCIMSNAVHCLCVVDSHEEAARSALTGGHWATFNQILDMARRGSTAQMLNDEMVRLFSVVVASKTYDRQGRRRYPVRHYRADFRLGEIATLDVDFADTQWLAVANFNQDSPFYRLRRLWRRYVYGQRY